MFQSLRQQRAVSPAQETPRAIPSIKLTAATPLAPSSTTISGLAPRKDDHTPRRVVPKRTLVLHEAPPSLPVPRPRIEPVKDHNTESRLPLSPRADAGFGSTGGRFKIFVDPPQDVNATPRLVQKKKSRAALSSIKWALGDRTNGLRDSSNKPGKLKDLISAVESDKEKSDKEKWKWTLGRSRKDGKDKFGRSSPTSGSQPSSVRTQSGPFSSVSSGYTLSRAVSPAPVASRSATPVPVAGAENSTQPKTGSIAVRAMRSVRSMAKIGGWTRSESPTTSMGKRLAKNSMKGKEPTCAVGSGESWLVGSLSSAGSPTRDVTSTVRPQQERRPSTHSEKPLPGIRFGSIVPGRRSRLSTSTASSGESVLPRESTSTRGPSIDSRRTSTSSRRSSGAASSVMASSFWMPSSPIPEAEGQDQPTPNPKRDSKSTDGLRRSALSNVFDLSMSSDSSDTPSPIRICPDSSMELYGEPLPTSSGAQASAPPDPFAAGDVDSYLPQTIRGLSAPPEVAMNVHKNALSSSLRPRPVSDQGGICRSLLLPGEMISENTGGLTMVNAATTELSDLINRLDLTTTPEASPARRWLPATPGQSPDAMPEFAIATVERAIRQRYPDVPSSVRSEGNGTFSADSSFGTEPTPNPRKVYNMGNLPLSGSVADLRKGSSIGPGPFLSSTLREESSMTSLRPYRVPNIPAIHLSPSSEPSSGSPSSIATDGLVNRRTIRRPRHSMQPSFLSSEESLREKLQQLSPRARDFGMKSALGNSYDDADENSLSSGRDDPTSESSDDVADSDAPDEVRAAIAHKEDDTVGSFQSLEDSLSICSRPLSEISSQFAEPTTSSYPHPFSITVTAPSLSSHDSDIESPVEDERDRGDDTGKQSFDFTREINRLNQGGARESFVEQLEAAFRVPDELKSPTALDYGSQDGSPTALQWDLRDAGSNSTLRKPSPGHLNPDFRFGTPPNVDKTNTVKITNARSGHSRTNTETSILSEHEISLLKDLDASMYALATLNLSLVHPTSQSTLIARQPTPVDPPVMRGASPDLSLLRDVDSSAYKIATIDLSLIHASDGQPSQTAPTLDGPAIQESSVPDSAVELSFIEVSRDRRLSIESDTSSKRRARSPPFQGESTNSHSRQESELSVSSFGSILYGGVSDPFGYKYDDVSELPSTANSSKPSSGHGHSDSIASIPSISSYGQIIKGGNRNPFGYAASFKTAHTRDISGDFDNSAGSYPDDSAEPDSRESVRRHKAHKSTDSDRSTFYFRSKEPPPPLPLPPLPESYSTHKRDESVTSLGPPVSLHNSSFRRHTRNRASNDSGSSIAHAYSNYGANGGRAVWAKHQSDASVDSIGSDFSAAGVARPGLGDKMFSSAANYCGAPLTSILASPSASDADMSEDRDQYSKSDSMIDHRRSSGDSDSFLKPSDVSDASIFGAQVPKSASSRGLLFGENAGNQRRPLSVFSSISISSSANVRDDDTMISMLGGGHVSRKAVDETFSASPCFKSKPRKKQPNFRVKVDPAVKASAGAHQQPCNPNTALASQPSSTFGKRRMALASQGLLERHSLEDTVLSGDGSDNSSIAIPFVNKPMAPSMQRNIFAESLSSKEAAPPPATIVLTPAAPDTPPTSDCESMNSQSNIDVTRLGVSDFPHSSSVSSGRIRARGHGHRRRSASPSADVTTILEEIPGLVSNSFSSSGSSVSSMASTVPSTRFDLLNGPEPHVDIVDVEDDTHDEMMQRYLTLRKQALDVVQQSKLDWADTDFSRFALSTFVPPKSPKAIRAFYDHSIRTYTHLPMDLCIRRPRTSSRPTPYKSRTPKKTAGRRMAKFHSRTESMEQAMSCISPPSLAALPPNSPFVIDRSFSALGNMTCAITAPVADAFKPAVRPRVTSKARRNALGWSKQRVAADEKPELPAPFSSITARGKENAEGLGMLKSPNDSLRISRPRPKSRPQSMLGTVRAK